MEFTAKDVAKLREETGAGFADCKNALTTAKSFDEAIKLIEKRASNAPRRSRGRIARRARGWSSHTSTMAATWACCSS